MCHHWEANPPAGKILDMSPETQTPEQYQKLYHDERIRVLTLEKKNARLQGEFEKEKTTREILQDKLDTTEAVSELKDATIQDLQTAFDKANRPRGSGDDQVEELRAKIKLLEDENKNLSHKIIESARGDWDNVLPRLESGLIQRITILSSKLKESQKELLDVKSELSNATKALSNVNVEFMELKEYNQTLQNDYQSLETDVFEWMDDNDERLEKLKSDLELGLKIWRQKATSEAKYKEAFASSIRNLDALLHSFGPPSSPPSPSRKPAKAPKSSTEYEMLRLKDRQTLHQLAP